MHPNRKQSFCIYTWSRVKICWADFDAALTYKCGKNLNSNLQEFVNLLKLQTALFIVILKIIHSPWQGRLFLLFLKVIILLTYTTWRYAFNKARRHSLKYETLVVKYKPLGPEHVHTNSLLCPKSSLHSTIKPDPNLMKRSFQANFWKVVGCSKLIEDVFSPKLDVLLCFLIFSIE